MFCSCKDRTFIETLISMIGSFCFLFRNRVTLNICCRWSSTGSTSSNDRNVSVTFHHSCLSQHVNPKTSTAFRSEHVGWLVGLSTKLFRLPELVGSCTFCLACSSSATLLLDFLCRLKYTL